MTDTNTSNITRIDNMTPAAFDFFMDFAADPEAAHDAGHLNAKERLQVAIALKWDLRNPIVSHWINC